jgi:predicted nucleic acid-binding protein
MNHFKLLIDTNVVIGLEDFQPVQLSLAELVRLTNQYGVGLFVDGANYDDVARDNNTARRVVTQSKLAKFQKLRGVPVPDNVGLATRFGPAKSENDRSDVRLLAAVNAKAVDFLVTQDNGLRRRAEKAGLGASVLTVEETLHWLKQTFTPVSVSLPHVVERKAYELSREHAIFTSLRADYPEFDQWFDKASIEIAGCLK